MKNARKLLALFLVLTLCFSLSMNAMAYEVETTPQANLSGKTILLHSNDVHGALAGYATIAQLKNELTAMGAEVVVIDMGDFSQGDPNVSISKGANAVTMMNAVGYDYAILGNHEFDYGVDQLKQNLTGATFQVLCANVFKDGKALFPGHAIHTTKGGVKIGFFSLETPETRTKVHPGYVKDITFLANTNGGSDLNDCAQAEINALKAEGADLVIALTHLGVAAESAPDHHRSSDVYAATTGIDLMLDGHSHTVMTMGENNAPVQSTGTKFEYVGVVVIDDASKAIESRFLVPTASLKEDPAVAEKAAELIAEVDSVYGKVIATSEVTLNGAKAPNGNRDSETNNGDLVTDALLWKVLSVPGALTVDADHAVCVTNGGGIRAAINPGDVTMKDVNTVLPFGNTVAVVYIKGSELLEVLEASTYAPPIGGYPQTAGIQFTLDTTKAYDPNPEAYPGSTYYGPASIQRVTITAINGKPFDPNATYAVVTNDFCADGGDTYYVFKNASDKYDTGVPMDEAVAEYLTTELKGVISAAKYAEPRGDQTILSATSAAPATPATPAEPAPATPAEPTPAVPAEPADAAEYYVVVPGDNLWRIAKKIYGSGEQWEKLVKLNNLKNPDYILIGQTLRVK